MDEGHLSVTGADHLVYVSNKQSGMFRIATKIQLARACPNCGYVEMYLDPNELKSKLSK